MRVRCKWKRGPLWLNRVMLAISWPVVALLLWPSVIFSTHEMDDHGETTDAD